MMATIVLPPWIAYNGLAGRFSEWICMIWILKPGTMKGMKRNMTQQCAKAPASAGMRPTAGVPNPIVTMCMADGGRVEMELYPDVAPETVRNFIHLVQNGFYDGLIFHRVIDGFMIQGGCPNGTGMGGPGWSIRGEFAQNGFANNLKHTDGVLSMARSMMPDSAGSQFFIMVADAPHLDGSYAAFGKVVSGLDVVHRIGKLPTDHRDRPLEAPVIRSMQVDTFGVAYDEPKKIR